MIFITSFFMLLGGVCIFSCLRFKFRLCCLVEEREFEMPVQQILQAAKLSLTKENGFLILVLVSLVVVESFVERDFQCLCEHLVREVFFFFYLLIPAFIIFTVTFCIMCELDRQESDGETQTSGRCDRLTFKHFIPSFFWMLMFLCDGRSVACVATTLKGDYADSSPLPPWEWCDKNRTLTADQKKADNAYIWSKGMGFSLLLFIAIGILVYECRRELGASSEEIAAEQGTAGTLENRGQQTHTQTGEESKMTPLHGAAGTEESGGQETPNYVETEV